MMWLKTGTIPNKEKKKKNEEEGKGETGCKKGGMKPGRNGTPDVHEVRLPDYTATPCSKI